jgi:hypothetical protein
LAGVSIATDVGLVALLPVRVVPPLLDVHVAV